MRNQSFRNPQGMDEDLPSWAELDGDFPDWAEMDTLVDPGPAEYPSVVSGQGDNPVWPQRKQIIRCPHRKQIIRCPQRKQIIPCPQRKQIFSCTQGLMTILSCRTLKLLLTALPRLLSRFSWQEHLAAEALEVTPSPKQAPPSPPSTVEQTATRPEPLEPAISEEPTKQPPAVVNVDSDNVPEATWKARLRRVFKPQRDGSYQVPSEFVDMYKSTEGQDKIFALFQRAQYDSAP